MTINNPFVQVSFFPEKDERIFVMTNLQKEFQNIWDRKFKENLENKIGRSLRVRMGQNNLKTRLSILNLGYSRTSCE